jgi:hypothetical protein
MSHHAKSIAAPAEGLGESRKGDASSVTYCVTPSGRTDGCMAYCKIKDGVIVCAFCERPLESNGTDEKK